MYQTPKIYNVALTTKDTEYSITVPEETQRIQIRSRESSDIKLAYASGESGTNFVTIVGGSGFELSGCQFTNLVLYMQSPDGGDVAEIVFWK